MSASVFRGRLARLERRRPVGRAKGYLVPVSDDLRRMTDLERAAFMEAMGMTQRSPIIAKAVQRYKELAARQAPAWDICEARAEVMRRMHLTFHYLVHRGRAQGDAGVYGPDLGHAEAIRRLHERWGERLEWLDSGWARITPADVRQALRDADRNDWPAIDRAKLTLSVGLRARLEATARLWSRLAEDVRQELLTTHFRFGFRGWLVGDPLPPFWTESVRQKVVEAFVHP